MIYLSGTANYKLLDILIERGVGLMAQPATGYEQMLPRFGVWAADNGCYSQGGRFSLDAYLVWLERLRPHQATCLFAVAPDVMGDAAATWQRSAPVLPVLRQMGYRAAVVAQDGFEDTQPCWDAFDCLFVGGTTEWKLSRHAWDAVRQARQRGKWVHMGRVNSHRRVTTARLMGCQSVDGTYLAFGPDKNIGKLAGWLRYVEQQPHMDFVA
jgi:hypothetical protein